MRLASIDFTADYAVFFIALIVFTIILAVVLERASPSRKTRRRVDKIGRGRDRAGELIE